MGLAQQTVVSRTGRHCWLVQQCLLAGRAAGMKRHGWTSQPWRPSVASPISNPQSPNPFFPPILSMCHATKNFRDRFASFRETARRYGVGAAIGHFLDRLAGRLLALDASRLLWLDRERLPEPPASDCGAPPAFRFLTAAEVRTLAADPRTASTRRWPIRLAGGRSLCFAAFSAGRLAAYGWLALGRSIRRTAAASASSFPPTRRISTTASRRRSSAAEGCMAR